MVGISIRPDLSGLQRTLLDFRQRQVPFAAAVALNRLARGVATAEQDEVRKTFDHPTPFTQNAFRTVAATKANLTAVVAAKDIQAKYLEPYVDGGDRWLGNKRAMLAPIAQAVNQYGNLPRGTLKRLQGRKDIFIGKVKTKGGEEIGGVWQRPASAGRVPGMKRGMVAQPRGGLKLLIRFEDTTPVRKHLAFRERAEAYVRRNARAEFTRALQEALRSGRGK